MVKAKLFFAKRESESSEASQIYCMEVSDHGSTMGPAKPILPKLYKWEIRSLDVSPDGKFLLFVGQYGIFWVRSLVGFDKVTSEFKSDEIWDSKEFPLSDNQSPRFVSIGDGKNIVFSVENSWKEGETSVTHSSHVAALLEFPDDDSKPMLKNVTPIGAFDVKHNGLCCAKLTENTMYAIWGSKDKSNSGLVWMKIRNYKPEYYSEKFVGSIDVQHPRVLKRNHCDVEVIFPVKYSDTCTSIVVGSISGSMFKQQSNVSVAGEPVYAAVRVGERFFLATKKALSYVDPGGFPIPIFPWYSGTSDPSLACVFDSPEASASKGIREDKDAE